jgi:hypothetical protein
MKFAKATKFNRKSGEAEESAALLTGIRSKQKRASTLCSLNSHASMQASSSSLQPLHKCAKVHLVPAFHDLIILDDQKGRPVEGLLLPCSGKAKVIAEMCHGDPPANRDPLTLCDNVLQVNVEIGKGSTEGAMDGLEALGPYKNRVRFGKAMGFAELAEHFVDRRFAFLVPDLLKPSPQQKFVGL